MTLPGNGTTKRIIAGVVSALAIIFISMLLSDEKRISVLETQMDTITRTLETNRVENRQEHQSIGEKLDLIQREVVKK